MTILNWLSGIFVSKRLLRMFFPFLYFCCTSLYCYMKQSKCEITGNGTDLCAHSNPLCLASLWENRSMLSMYLVHVPSTMDKAVFVSVTMYVWVCVWFEKMCSDLDQNLGSINVGPRTNRLDFEHPWMLKFSSPVEHELIVDHYLACCLCAVWLRANKSGTITHVDCQAHLYDFAGLLSHCRRYEP